MLVLVPEAEPLVGPLRDELDPSARQGVPAHVTVLYPFVPAASVDGATIGTLRTAVEDLPPFSCRFGTVGWFGEDFVWLGPDATEPFDRLTERVASAFPEHPPYAGEHDPRPHLTVGYRRHSSLDALRAAAARLGPGLPVTARVDRLHLLAGGFEGQRWHRVAEIPLGGGVP